MRVALLAHEKFPDRAKTAVGILRYADHDVVGVLDRDNNHSHVSHYLPDVQDAPIVSSMSAISEPVDALIIGIAPIGGGFDESWRPDVRSALERGCDVISGLHYFLQEDEEFRELAAENNCEIWDVRKPHEDIGVSDGVADSVEAEVILTVGTDCSVGKMTTTMELLEEAKSRDISAAVIPTGQTGIMIEGWGNPVDRVISDFTAGSVEEMILERGNDYDYLFVEGQGSIVHPAYSAVTCGIVHGAMPDKLVLCHTAGRTSVHGYDQELPPISEYVSLYEEFARPVSDSRVVAGALNTQDIESDTQAHEQIKTYSQAIDAPATDPIRFNISEIFSDIV